MCREGFYMNAAPTFFMKGAADRVDVRMRGTNVDIKPTRYRSKGSIKDDIFKVLCVASKHGAEQPDNC
jgi:hypothetical protein